MPLLPEEKCLSNDFSRILLISFTKNVILFSPGQSKNFPPIHVTKNTCLRIFYLSFILFFSTDNDPIAHGKCVLFGHGLN